MLRHIRTGLITAGLLLAMPAHATSLLGAHTLLAHEDGLGPATATTASISTSASGSSLLIFNAGYASNNAGPSDSKGNTWTALGAPVVYRGYNGAFDVKAYLVLNAIGGAGHTVSIVKNGQPSGEITVPFVEIRQGGRLQSVAQNYPNAAAVLQSGTVTTTGPATLIAIWWGDASGLQHSAIPDNGFTIIENFVILPPNSAVQCVVAYKQVPRAGSYLVNWTNTPEQGAPLWLLAFQDRELIFAGDFD